MKLTILPGKTLRGTLIVRALQPDGSYEVEHVEPGHPPQILRLRPKAIRSMTGQAPTEHLEIRP